MRGWEREPQQVWQQAVIHVKNDFGLTLMIDVGLENS